MPFTQDIARAPYRNVYSLTEGYSHELGPHQDMYSFTSYSWSQLQGFLICFTRQNNHCYWEWNVFLNIRICQCLATI